jgi:biotin carboxyl carrier protein
MKFKGFVGDSEHDVEVEPIEGGYAVTIDDETFEVDTSKLEASFYSLICEGRSYDVSVTEEPGEVFAVRHGGFNRTVRLIDPVAAVAGAHLGDSGVAEIKSVMPGRVVKVLVQEGDEVAEGQGIIVLEAMKMENEVTAPRAGAVKGLHVQEGQALETGSPIAVIE